jgi:2-oxoglutarate dehydrogenase complex dehydrogenase (E1) component-like enzyme
MPKRRCVFTESSEAEYPFLKEDQQVGKVLCFVCKSQFSIEHGGRSDILQHIKKRKQVIVAESKSCSKKVTSYFTKETITDECKHIAAEEGLFAFETIRHNHSFQSMDCTSSVIRRLHKEKSSCGRIKCESIVVNVLAPFAMPQVFEELERVTYRMNLFMLQIQVKPEWMNGIQNHNF